MIAKSRVAWLAGILLTAMVAVFLANIWLGSAAISLPEVWLSLWGSEGVDPVACRIVIEFRLPRAVAAAMGGAALAVSGLLMQTVFRNPLADPFVLGVNAGASLGVALALLWLAPTGIALASDMALTGQTLVVVAATLGSAAVLALVMIFAQRVDVMSLLILGLMISYAVGAVVSMLMFYSMAERIQTFFTWSFGTFGNVTWTQMRIFAPCIALGLVATLFMRKPLDALLMGDGYAASLGTRVKVARATILGVASLLAGAVTGFCGPIGFIGVAAPHVCRYLLRTGEHRILLPASMAMGSVIALTADLAAKAPGFEGSLPLNAVTALVGAPIIIAALLKQRDLRSLFGR